jgi:energy-coupling factor transporter ATP-binding protein EcfA2
MLIKKVMISNVTCFDLIELDFTGQDSTSKWVAIVGENGTGKSTILKSIALALMGPVLSLDVADRSYLARFQRKQTTRPPSITLQLSSSWKDKNKIRNLDIYNTTVLIYRANVSRSLRQNLSILLHEGDEKEAGRIEKNLYSEEKQNGWFSCAYGPWRRIPSTQQSPRLEQINYSEIKSGRFITLFHDNYTLSSFSEWLIDLEFRRLKDNKSRADDDFKLAINTIEKILGDVKFSEINSDRDIIFKYGDSEVSLEQMSDGYRSVTAWVGDLVRQLVEAFPDSKNPLYEEGVVIIDEIDIHLHPAWQKNIVEQTKSIFPNTQFIVSSHSPFVIQDFSKDDTIIVLERIGSNVTAKKWGVDIQGWRVDQILTSGLFKLTSTRNNDIETLELKRIDLLNKKVLSRITNEEEKELEKLEGYLDENLSPPIYEDDQSEDFKNLVDLLKQNLIKEED